jgi:U3 small nucleolar RNA-associated protein 6
MSGSSDKARYYLEEQVPELQDLLRKKIFTEAQIKTIASKRSSFEHILNARGSHPTDYARYAEYEMNLESLRKKKVKRMGVKNSGHAGQRRVFFILDRGVRKFPGDLKLWMQYLEFCRKEGARKKIKEVLTRLLRLHPTKAELWGYAARYAADEEGDMMAARGYMQRGLRFCEGTKSLWVDYARLECIYVAKIAARRRILGVDGEKRMEEKDEGEDMLALPEVTAEDINPTPQKDDELDEVALRNLENTPALTGAIPIAIFDAAMKQFGHDEKLGEQFFDMVAEFDRSPAFERVLQHLVFILAEAKPNTVSTIACQMRLPLVGVEVGSPQFPTALGESLQLARKAVEGLPLKKHDIARRAILLLLPLSLNSEIDPDVQSVLSASIRQFVKTLDNGDRAADLVDILREQKREDHARRLLQIGVKLHGSNERLLQAHAVLNTVSAG